MTKRPPFALLLAGLGLLVVLLFLASLAVGPSDLPPARAFAALFADDGAATLVMREIRLPRAILAVAVGATLGLSGALLQGWLRNPLADTGVLGIGSGAALGAVVVIVSGLAGTAPFALPVAALLGAGTAALVVTMVAGRHAAGETLILAGVAVSSLTAALTTLVLNLSPNPFATHEIVFWMLGSLADRSLVHVALALPFMALGWIAAARLGRDLDLLTLGGETAASMGVDLGRVRWLALFSTAASVGAATAVSGVIGFVGLVVPHLLRPAVGSRPSRLLAASALGGAALLSSADLAVRIVLPHRDLKLGVVTALIGAPFFFRLLLARRRGA
ncbi:MAG: iron ABC transporter permease [Phyllobacteriaceae bacterium]|nr:iron ABC transporter permease [Phyllobacteriaceae bacterium]